MLYWKKFKNLLDVAFKPTNLKGIFKSCKSGKDEKETESPI